MKGQIAKFSYGYTYCCDIESDLTEDLNVRLENETFDIKLAQGTIKRWLQKPRGKEQNVILNKRS